MLPLSVAVFVGHVVHVAPPTSALYSLVVQTSQKIPPVPGAQPPTQSFAASEPAGLLELVGQNVHVSEVCAVLALYLPASQAVHNAAPVVALKEPATQAAGVPPSAL